MSPMACIALNRLLSIPLAPIPNLRFLSAPAMVSLRPLIRLDGTAVTLGFPETIMLMSLFYPSWVFVLRDVETIRLVLIPLLHRLAIPVASPNLLSVVRTLHRAPLMTLGTAIGTGFPSKATAILLPRPVAALGLGETANVIFRGALTEHLLPDLLRPIPLKLVPPSVPNGLPLPVEPVLRTLPGTAVTCMFLDIIIASLRPVCPSTRSPIMVAAPPMEEETTPFLIMLLSHLPRTPQGTLRVPNASLHAV